jgi:hypothetical protein
MTQIRDDMTEVEISVEEWLVIRVEAGKKIDPRTAEVMRVYNNMADPYGVYADPPNECQQTWGKMFFARSPDSEIWVFFGDLPYEIVTELWVNMENGKYSHEKYLADQRRRMTKPDR